MDRISNLPDSVIEKILSSLPLHDAVETCVLAKAWRHKWVRRSKLVFDDNFFFSISKVGDEADKEESDEVVMYKNVNILSAILLQHIGVLDELCLHLPVQPSVMKKREIVIPSIQFALRKGVKTLRLNYCPIPAFIYSYTQLTHLELIPDNKEPFFLPTSFQGLPNLVSFEISTDHETGDKLTNFLSKCPKLKTVRMSVRTTEYLQFRVPSLEYLTIGGQWACICFPEAENLKKLVIRLQDSVDEVHLAEKYRRMNIFSSLVKLEHFMLGHHTLQILASSGAPKRFTGILGELKTISLVALYVSELDELRFLLCLLASSPKLHQVNMHVITPHGFYDEGKMEIDSYKDHKFENLESVLVQTAGDEFDIKMIELLLNGSSNLKKMSIEYIHSYDMGKSNNLLKKVLRLTRASAKATIEFG